jgi:hypothetical protein
MNESLLKILTEATIMIVSESPSVKATKPLSPSIYLGRQKRDGKRHRKIKKRPGMAELPTGADQMKFGMVRILKIKFNFYLFYFLF